MLFPEYSGWPRPGTVTLSSSMRYRIARSSTASPRMVVAGLEPIAVAPPLRLAIEGVRRPTAQRAHQPAGERAGRRGNLAARRLVHERHELVGEAGHRAADADAADVRTAADPVHPAALGDVAAHHRSPAA